ncbi:MAG TPA: UDP-N-acetylmuramate:L-alanyl-gamma-D-glutamyl-meso-diaminopimelate ligase [Arenicellales bacterium]|nr:UDP-N-acetylmuramate:L-alanyl-gamma-D-glutamyl-meso-diaminopimelate ligase [Arenicellales bacterium]
MSTQIHIIGIGGTFMGGLALIAREAGHLVSGSDQALYPPMSDLLEAQNIPVHSGYEATQLATRPDLVVVGNALSRGNPLVEYVLNEHIPYTSGPQWLMEHLLPGRPILAVAGTHGKTTTSAMVTFILEQGGHEPGFLIGGVPGNSPISARLGKGEWFVIEADEYDTAFFDKRSKFLHYRPEILVLGNLEFDHADIFDSIDDIERQFEHLLRTVPEDGTVVVNTDHPRLDALLKRGCWSQVIRYSCCGTAAPWQATARQADCRRFDVSYNGQHMATVDWPVIGRHNMENALAAIAASHAVGVDAVGACASLADFRLPCRRLERVNPQGSIALYDDFAHHPSAIRETLRSLRSVGGKGQLIAVLEPRSNTMKRGIHGNTLTLALAESDLAIVRRRADLDWDPQELALKAHGTTLIVCDTLAEIVDTVRVQAAPGDQVVMMSNGNFDGLKNLLGPQLN